MDYSKIRDDLQTGDIVLFRGKGRISRWIRWFCSLVNCFKKTWASHVGVIVVAEGRVMLFESTSIRGGIKGVRLVPVSEAIPFYDGAVKIRRLECNRDIHFHNIVSRFVGNTIGIPYERNIRELMGSAWNGWITGHNKPNYETYFCSELVAHLYQNLFLLPLIPPANEYTPEDFRRYGYVDYAMRTMLRPAKLCEEIDVEIKPEGSVMNHPQGWRPLKNVNYPESNLTKRYPSEPTKETPTL